MDSQERFENVVGLVEAHQYEWAIWQAAERQEPLLKALADCREAVFSDSGPESEHFAQAIGCPEAVPAYVKDVVEKLRKSRVEALLDAERAREERNREHVRLNAEWMAKCEELRNDIDRYQALCAAVYQMTGAVNAPVRFLDSLSDAANGELEARAPTESLLPVDPTEAGCFPPWSAVEAINAERDRTIEECANVCDELEYADPARHIRALAKKYRKAAAAIRALTKEGS